MGDNLKYEFEKFIKHLVDCGQDLEDYEKKIINLIYYNFDEITKRSNRGSDTRGKFISDLIIADLENKNYELPQLEIKSGDNENIEENKYLSKLKVGYFRGFREVEIFSFHKKFNLIYGYNGTGKSSFSEALEYGLTNNIKEAEHRGYKDCLNKYTEHIYDKGSKIVEIYDNNENLLNSDVDKYRFSFIEKSRIDDFVRYKNHGASDSIRNLFGLGGFNNFINEFNNDIDGKLAKEDSKGIELLTKNNEYKSDIEEQKKILFKDFQDIKTDWIEQENIGCYEKLLKEEISKNQEINHKNQEIRIDITNQLSQIDKKNNSNNKYKIIIPIVMIVIVILFIFLSKNWYYLLLLLFTVVVVFIKNKEKTQLESKLALIKDISSEKTDNLSKKILTYKVKADTLKNKEEKYEFFLQENESNIKIAEKNKEDKWELEKYEIGYKLFYKRIHNYKDNISKGLIKDKIEEKVIWIFNELCGNRKNGVNIRSIEIPINEGSKLILTNDQGEEIDALKILSEGNLRCLGLSILLAKIITSNISFVIYDDLVNALDEDFRLEIYNLLSNKVFSNIQQIICSHSENFINSFSERITSGDYIQYNLEQTDLKKIRKNETKSDLISQIRLDLDKGEKNNGLNKCRKSLEKSLHSIGKNLISDQISIGCYSNLQPNTAQKLNAIKSYFNKKNIHNHIVIEIDKINPNTNFYKYLNQGSHDSDKILEDITSTEAEEVFKVIEKIKEYSTLK